LSYDALFELYLEQKLSGVGGVVSILGDPPAKLKALIMYDWGFIKCFSSDAVSICINIESQRRLK
jgi:hypothetical protein